MCRSMIRVNVAKYRQSVKNLWMWDVIVREQRCGNMYKQNEQGMSEKIKTINENEYDI